MTFTEAAVEVLRLVGKPLHYKKIAEIAIERNLLSHVGKTPEITMSSRLATMVRKDRGEAPIIKVKPGVFGLRDFAEDILETAKHESGHDYELPPAAEEPTATDSDDPAPEDGPAVAAPALPGSEVFPEEDDDDELILSKIQQPKENEEEPKRRKRRRRRKRREDEAAPPTRERSRRGGRERQEREDVRGNWERGRGGGEPSGGALADSIEMVLSEGRRQARRLTQVAEALVKKGTLEGDAAALGPTLAAAIRADIATRASRRDRQRFHLVGDQLELFAWSHPHDALKAEVDVVRLAQKQRDHMRRALLRKMSDMPAASLLELLATWLNAAGVSALRGVARPDAASGEFHLAGTLRQGPMEVPIAVLVTRSAVGREKVIELRGALHHYGDARAVWLITLGNVLRGAREEVAMSSAAPCALFDGMTLAAAMEEAGVGLRQVTVPLAVFDTELLDQLRGPGRVELREEVQEDADAEPNEGKRRRRRRKDRRGDDAAPEVSEAAGIPDEEVGGAGEADDAGADAAADPGDGDEGDDASDAADAEALAEGMAHLDDSVVSGEFQDLTATAGDSDDFDVDLVGSAESLDLPIADVETDESPEADGETADFEEPRA